ncbi:Uncharacterised protein [Klebsiella variicola]|nr:Uncharacterised protein [Klebsiella variicola]
MVALDSHYQILMSKFMMIKVMSYHKAKQVKYG